MSITQDTTLQSIRNRMIEGQVPDIACMTGNKILRIVREFQTPWINEHDLCVARASGDGPFRHVLGPRPRASLAIVSSGFHKIEATLAATTAKESRKWGGSSAYRELSEKQRMLYRLRDHAVKNPGGLRTTKDAAWDFRFIKRKASIIILLKSFWPRLRKPGREAKIPEREQPF